MKDYYYYYYYYINAFPEMQRKGYLEILTKMIAQEAQHNRAYSSHNKWPKHV